MPKPVQKHAENVPHVVLRQSLGKNNREIDLAVFGAGTAAYALAEAIAGNNRITRRLAGVRIVDFDRVDQNNAITCEQYASHEGEWKAAVLANLWMRWLRRAGVKTRPGMVIGIPSLVQSIDYASGFAKSRGRGKDNLIVWGICLDDWEARLHAERNLRRMATESRHSNVVLLQISLDRKVAQVRVHGTGYKNVCQVCGLDTIPEREPCVLFRRAASADQGHDTDKTELVRGDLRAESRAAGHHACQVIAALLDRDYTNDVQNYDSWIDTKTQIYLDEESGVISKETSKRYMRPGCFGPHSPAGDTLDMATLIAEVSLDI